MSDERPFDYPGSAQGDVFDDPIMDCAWCNREGHESEGEWVRIGATYVDHMQVSEEYDWLCEECYQDYIERRNR